MMKQVKKKMYATLNTGEETSSISHAGMIFTCHRNLTYETISVVKCNSGKIRRTSLLLTAVMGIP